MVVRDPFEDEIRDRLDAIIAALNRIEARQQKLLKDEAEVVEHEPRGFGYTEKEEKR
jgi:hypothetical protein